MKIKGLLSAFTALALNANAGIIDNDHNLANTFKDTDTGLVWMDFGVNNNQSFTYVESQLVSGGLYEGWRLPTTQEVYTMWSNVADFDNVDADEEVPDNGYGHLYASDYNSFMADDSVWEHHFDAIGYNTEQHSSNFSVNSGIGMFNGAHGLSWVSFHDVYNTDASITNESDKLMWWDDMDYALYPHFQSALKDHSTLLVRSSVDVPEPSTMAMFALALLGLGAKRRRLI